MGSLERETFHFRRLKMKSTFLLLAALATCNVFCKPSIEDNSIFNIHASLLSSESAEADDEVGEENRTSKDEPWEEDPTLVDFKIISFDCPDCMERDWRSIINVHGTPTNSSLIVKQPGFYVVLPIFPDPDHGKPVWVIPKTNSWDGILESKPPATIWFDKGDEINFRTTTENMRRVPGTIIRVKKI